VGFDVIINQVKADKKLLKEDEVTGRIIKSMRDTIDRICCHVESPAFKVPPRILEACERIEKECSHPLDKHTKELVKYTLSTVGCFYFYPLDELLEELAKWDKGKTKLSKTDKRQVIIPGLVYLFNRLDYTDWEPSKVDEGKEYAYSTLAEHGLKLTKRDSLVIKKYRKVMRDGDEIPNSAQNVEEMLHEYWDDVEKS